MRSRVGVLWLPAVALVAAAADMAQVAAGTGFVGVTRLAFMASAVYAVGGLLCSTIVGLVRRLSPTPLFDDAGVLGLALSLWTLIVAGGYLNLVHLPPITSAVTLLANMALVTAAVLAWLFVARTRLSAAWAGRPGALVVVSISGLAIATVVSLPHLQPADHQARIQSQAPNVVVVVVDSLRFDHTGVGGATAATPFIDELARQGTAYRRAYAQASWTKPSVASLFTSLYPSTHGANLRRDRLSSEPRTMAETFSAAGYRTAVFSANPWISPAFGFDRGVATFIESEHETFVRLVILLRLLKLPDRLLSTKPMSSALAYLETVFALRQPRRTNCDRDVALIDAFSSWIGADPGVPIFAYLHLMSPHIPYDPPGGPHDFANQDQVALLRSTEALPAARRDLLIDLYSRCVAHGDLMVGRIMEILEDRNLSDSTVLVVTSDHGEEFFEHGHWGHGKSLYDELVHVPLVMRGPGVGVGVEDETTVMLVDVGPTVASLARLNVSSAIAGRTMSTLTVRRSAYAELIREGGLEIYMVYEAGKKYLESTAQLGQQLEAELYDLDSDPHESNNLATAGLEAWPQRLSRIRTDARSARVARDAVPEIGEDSEQRLRALGYLN